MTQKSPRPRCHTFTPEKLPAATAEQLVEIELRNMAPVLEAMGISLTSEKVREGLAAARQVIVVMQHARALGFLTFSLSAPKTAFVKSIQVRHEGGNAWVLFRLLREAARLLSTNGVETVTSVVQRTNPHSLDLHRQLGFIAEKEFAQAIRFTIPAAALARKILRKEA